MTSIIDICNRALSDAGTQSQIASLLEASPEAVTCNLWIDSLRRALLRTAPWAFARTQVALTQLGDLSPDNTSPFPWLYKYQYPGDCIKFRYIIAPPTLPIIGSITPPVVGSGVAPIYPGPSRANRWMINTEVIAGVATRTIITNVPDAIGVYTFDAQDPTLFDPLFEQALIAALGYKVVIPLSGNVGEKETFAKIAADSILQARIVDGNEGLTSSNIPTPSWIDARNGGAGESDPGNWGNHMCDYEDMSWGA